MATPAKASQNNSSPLALVKKADFPTRPTQICRLSHRETEDSAIKKAQQIWDTYFEKMLATFNEPNPDLNRDLALDRTIRALGQRPLTSREQAQMVSSHSPSAICYRDVRSHVHLPSRQEAKLQKICAQEDALEELCSDAFDA